MSEPITNTFAGIQSKTWDRILRENGYAWQPPLTVHLPIQPAYSPDFVHVDCALNACRRRMFPGMRTRDPESDRRRAECNVLTIQFALDNPPFIPDFRQTKMRLLENRLPVVHADYFAWNLFYEFEYFCHRLDDRQSLLWIEIKVANESPKPQTAHIRVKVSLQNEPQLFDYHYVAFYWDQSKWRDCPGFRLDGAVLKQGDAVVGKALPGGFTLAWEPEAQFEADAFNKRFSCEDRYFVQPALRLPLVRDVIHASAPLAGRESRSFALALLVDVEAVTPAHVLALHEADPDQSRQVAIGHFESLVPSSPLTIVGNAGQYDDLLRYLPINTLQLLVDFRDGKGLTPTQGGSSERFFVWVWEAVCMLMPMLALGYFDAVRRVIEYMFSLQDGGCPPDGNFTTLKGAIGTTGPRWINATGSALGFAAEYAALSRDRAFLDTCLPKMLRAADWLIGEIRATRVSAPDGTRPLTYGLLPFGHATDGDIGHVLTLSDAYSYWGLERLACLLADVGHPRAEEIRRETDQYHEDIQTAIRQLARPDGFIERKIVTGQEGEKFTEKFKHVCGAIHYVHTGVLGADTGLFRKYMDYFEHNLADGYFTGYMDRDVVYIGTTDYLWHEAYLQAGEWKKAFMVMRAVVKYGMSQDTFQTQERFSRRDSAYTCWQPNGSGNGRLLDMILRSFYFEYRDKARGEVAVILGGMPYAWLVDNETTALRNLRTRRGLLGLEVVSVPGGGGFRLRLASDPGELHPVLRFPDFLLVTPFGAGIKPEGDGYFRLAGGLRSAEFLIGPGKDR